MGNDQRVGEVCIICELEKLRGIHLYTSFICLDCEKDMIHTETGEPNYQYYIRKLKKVNSPKAYS
ncbi:hypothetical protein J2S13_002662 [Oikeobacillus pervagus]|uniref:Sigma factor G inhibitor Gin n=1 Tax=Oikeobacillus pervagus TaxID=1325931 RepID=A0AAJ1T2Y5_9BACI|nr:sigma factor G inhibitor Gin [Oikeobacillus pervagus]MDQ0216222.1 hypothetical protein [Oikeobacillus pervagus]